MPPLVALIGRPNVGKSTLFNRLIRGNRAITHDRPGVTRDRLQGEVRRSGSRFALVDTGGVSLDESGQAGEGPEELRGFEAEVLDQVRMAIEEADLLVLVTDGRDGLTPLDERLADFARSSNKPVLLAVNKVDGGEKADMLTAEFHAVGLEVIPFSAAHSFNLRGLTERIMELLEKSEEAKSAVASAATPGTASGAVSESSSESAPESASGTAPEPEEELGKGLRLAVIGRPNVGKSSLVNTLTGQRRMIVSEIAGTTRDSVDVSFEAGGKQYMFVDTAGVRRRARIDDTVERFSVSSALKTAQRADVTILVLDAFEGVTAQDKRLIAFLDKYKIAFFAMVNKIDLVPREHRKKVLALYKKALGFCSYAPILTTSALTRAGLAGVLPTAEEVWAECGVRISTGVLNRSSSDAIQRHQPPLVKGRRAKFYYLTQAETRPPTFIFFVNDPERVKTSYVRYLENTLRKLFGLKVAPLRLEFRKSGREGRVKPN